MTLPERCPKCHVARAVRRSTVDFGTPDEYSFLYCTQCLYNVEETA